MIITKEFVNDAGRNSPMVRSSMVQAGDKDRVRALKSALISIGACEISKEDAKSLNLPVYQKKYAFLAFPMNFILLDRETFKHFKPLNDGVSLEIAYAKNGLIGLLRKEKENV